MCLNLKKRAFMFKSTSWNLKQVASWNPQVWIWKNKLRVEIHKMKCMRTCYELKLTSLDLREQVGQLKVSNWNSKEQATTWNPRL